MIKSLKQGNNLYKMNKLINIYLRAYVCVCGRERESSIIIFKNIIATFIFLFVFIYNM